MTSTAQSKLSKRLPGGLSFCLRGHDSVGGHKPLPPVSHRGVKMCIFALQRFVFSWLQPLRQNWSCWEAKPKVTANHTCAKPEESSENQRSLSQSGDGCSWLSSRQAWASGHPRLGDLPPHASVIILAAGRRPPSPKRSLPASELNFATVNRRHKPLPSHASETNDRPPRRLVEGVDCGGEVIVPLRWVPCSSILDVNKCCHQ